MEIDCKSFKYQAGKGIRKPRPLRMKAAAGGGGAAEAPSRAVAGTTRPSTVIRQGQADSPRKKGWEIGSRKSLNCIKTLIITNYYIGTKYYSRNVKVV